jgi:hypothetical protein
MERCQPVTTDRGTAPPLKDRRNATGLRYLQYGRYLVVRVDRVNFRCKMGA